MPVKCAPPSACATPCASPLTTWTTAASRSGSRWRSARDCASSFACSPRSSSTASLEPPLHAHDP
eukprot:28333-Eustigmatos_ZCMA.PRE.1